VAVDLRERSLATVADFKKEEIWQIFETTKDLKRRQKMGKPHEILKGKQLAMIFQKPSTRTRVSFEVGISQLGGHGLYLGASDLQLARGETIEDTARVLGRYVDCIMARVFEHEHILALIKYSGVPVINGLSNDYHPCQALTDLFTVWEKKGSLDNLKFAFVGDGDNNVTNSLMLLCAILGIDFSIASPRKYQARKDVSKQAKTLASKSGAKIEILTDPLKTVKNADIIATDVWVSMGREDREERLKAFKPYQLNQKLVKRAKKDVLVMHCLPAHRGEEITNEVIDGPQSIVFDEAENRLHLQKALMVLFL